MSNCFEEQPADEEVFFGKLSLKEIKKHILWNNHRNMKYVSASSKEHSDFKLIETHSSPDLLQKENVVCDAKSASCTSLSPSGTEAYPHWEVKPVDDSFLKVEKMVADLCVSPDKTVKKEELNNTLDIIDYILKNGPPNTSESVSSDQNEQEKIRHHQMGVIPKIEVDSNVTDHTESSKSIPLSDTQVKADMPTNTKSCAYYHTPAKNETIMTEKKSTPAHHRLDFKPKTPIFKTPANALSAKKPSVTSLKKTPMKANNAYQHIASPVASYIKNCPVAPLVKEVRPTKPLPGSSSIPKFVKNPALPKPCNKENVNLPSVAYKSAKKTQVIDMPDEEKLPQTQLMKKITSSLPKPRIMKHDHREMNIARRVMVSRQEDSFADLSLRQADVSVCTQKSAFNKPKKGL